jgi:SAM-dependent methyltransferase
MKNKENWKPSKFVYQKNRLRASRDNKQVGFSSRLMADLIAGFYDRILKKHAHGILLDLGCGKVPLYEAYRPYVEDNICVDWENSLHRNEFLDMTADLNFPLEMPDNSYDTIILSDVLEHIKKPRQLWEEMARVLKKEGILILNVPFFYWLHEEPYDYFRYTKYALTAMAEEVGFEIIEIEPIGGAPEVLADIIAKTIKMAPLIGKPLSVLVQYLTWLFVRTSFGSKVSRGTSNQFPLAYGMVAKLKQ